MSEDKIAIFFFGTSNTYGERPSFSHLYSAGVQEGLVVVLQSFFCVGLSCEPNERELAGLSVFGADDLCVRDLHNKATGRHDGINGTLVTSSMTASIQGGMYAEIAAYCSLHQEGTYSWCLKNGVHTSTMP